MGSWPLPCTKSQQPNLGFAEYLQYTTAVCMDGKKPVTETVEPLRRASNIGIEYGDIEFAMLSGTMVLLNQFDHIPVTALDQEMASCADRMKFYGQGKCLSSGKGDGAQNVLLMTLNP